MAYIQTEIESAVRGDGRHPMRDMPFRLRPFVCSFAEAPLHQFAGASQSGGTPLPYVSRESGAFRARGNGADDNTPDWLEGPTLNTPIPIDVQSFDVCCQMAYTLGQTDERLRTIRQSKGEKL